jgi:hypothetical protein
MKDKKMTDMSDLDEKKNRKLIKKMYRRHFKMLVVITLSPKCVTFRRFQNK